MAVSVFVTGATGYVGRRIIPLLLNRGHRVAALVRSGSESKAPHGCEIVIGDPLDRWTFVKAIAPGDTFLQLVGVPRPASAQAQQYLDIDLRSARESIAAAGAAEIGHFVYVSVAEAGRAGGAGRAGREER